MKIGQLTLFGNHGVIASWHWKWSISWRWLLSWHRRDPVTRPGLYWMRTFVGKGLLCGLNSRLLDDWSFHLHPNVKRRPAPIAAREPVAERGGGMDWEIYFVNPTSQFDQFVDEERTITQANTEEDARAIVRAMLGRFGRIREVRVLVAREPVAKREK